MATETKTAIEIPSLPTSLPKKTLTEMGKDFDFLTREDVTITSSSLKTLPLVQKHFNLPLHETKIVIPVNLLSRKTWLTMLGLDSPKPGQPSPLPSWAISLTSRLQQLRSQKTEKAIFVGGEPTKANASFFLKGRFKKVSPELRKSLLLGYLKEAIGIGFGPADTSFASSLLGFVTSSQTTTVIPASGSGVLTPEGKITIKKTPASPPPPSNGQQKTIQEQIADLTALVAMSMATKA